VLVELEAFDEVAVILPDLLPGRPDVFPVGFGRERELVSVGRDVAPQAGIAVPMPHPADIGALLQNGEVREAGLPEGVSDGDTRHPRAHNHDARIPLLVWLGHFGAPIAVISV
jgi:hypothetical protein